MALSLIVASPPALENTVLPRENMCTLRHPSYVAPPSVKSIKTSFLSNGTLVIAPMTLCPQWQAEIKRFAPWMTCLTLHKEEVDSVAEIASKDIVVISTFMVSNQRGRALELMRKLRKIHFHRIFLDESHLNHSRHADNSSDTNSTRVYKFGLAQLSSTHRYCVTGTPVGQSLADLYGQLRFLRVPLFCREDYWNQIIGMCLPSLLTSCAQFYNRLMAYHVLLTILPCDVESQQQIPTENTIFVPYRYCVHFSPILSSVIQKSNSR